jgi:hypothetical protein
MVGITGMCHHCLDYLLRMGLAKLLPGVVSNHDHPDLGLLSSWDYRSEPLFLAPELIFSN